MASPRKNGILPDRYLKRLIQEGQITSKIPIKDGQIQPASLDLRLGNKAYRLRSSFHPERSDVHTRLNVLDHYESDLVMYAIDLTQGGILEKGHVYLVPLLEGLALPKRIRGRANPKSSTGRLDIFTRMITDLNVGFDEVRSGYHGPLYLEIVPLSFTIRVQTGLALNQLRLVEGQPTVSDTQLLKLHRQNGLLFDNGSPPRNNVTLAPKHMRVNNGMFLRVDLHGNGEHNSIVGYRAKKNSHVVDLSRIGHYPALDFWEPIYHHSNDSLVLEPQEFYILASKERIRVPPGYATEMVAYEAACGELRTHYAGFFDPGFGAATAPKNGTPVVLEVRPHDVPFMIHDGQTFFKVIYERMIDNPDEIYGSTIGSSYHQQGLTLSKHFKW